MPLSFKDLHLAAKRYTALKSTEKASPWSDVLGGHKTLDGLSDALIRVLAQEKRRGISEDAPAMCIGGGEGMAGVTGDPPVSKVAQARWVRKKPIVRRRRG